MALRFARALEVSADELLHPRTRRAAAKQAQQKGPAQTGADRVPARPPAADCLENDRHHAPGIEKRELKWRIS